MNLSLGKAIASPQNGVSADQRSALITQVKLIHECKDA